MGHAFGTCKIDTGKLDLLESHRDLSAEQPKANLTHHLRQRLVVLLDAVDTKSRTPEMARVTFRRLGVRDAGDPGE